MSGILYYKGVHKVRILTESEGYWIVEADEDFEDSVNDKRVHVKKGERRIVPIETLYKQKTLPPMIKEHSYELQMEKKLKRLVVEEEKKDLESKNR